MLSCSKIILVTCLAITLASATPVTETTFFQHSDDSRVSLMAQSLSKPVPRQRIGILKRWVLRAYVRKLNKTYRLQQGGADPDRKARKSLGFGIAALALVFIPFYTVFLAIPFGILAIIYGKDALAGGTKVANKARIGKAFGWAALILFAVLLIVSVIIVLSNPLWIFWG